MDSRTVTLWMPSSSSCPGIAVSSQSEHWGPSGMAHGRRSGARSGQVAPRYGRSRRIEPEASAKALPDLDDVTLAQMSTGERLP